MQQNHHEQAARHHEEAAKHHKTAAKYVTEGNHEKAAYHAQAAHGHQEKANQHASRAATEHAQRSGSMKNEDLEVENGQSGNNGHKKTSAAH